MLLAPETDSPAEAPADSDSGDGAVSGEAEEAPGEKAEEDKKSE